MIDVLVTALAVVVVGVVLFAVWWYLVGQYTDPPGFDLEHFRTNPGEETGE